MQPTQFNLIDVLAVIKAKWKFIAGFVLLSLIVATVAVFLVPKYYRSTATIVAANPALADKARLFNPNIEGLYSNFGSSDDLDRLNGMASLDTTFKLLVDEFNLVKYYKLHSNDAPLDRRKAVLNLRDDIDITKTELNQLKIIVWTKDKNLSANIANRMTAIVHNMETGIWKSSYQHSLDQLNKAVGEIEKEIDSISNFLRNTKISADAAASYIAKRTALLEQVKEYYKSINEFKLAISNDIPALYVMEVAYPSAKADKPKKLNVLITVLLAGFALACILALLSYKKQDANAI